MDWTDEQAEAFSHLWRDARLDAGLSQQALAQALGMTQATISQLEKGPYLGMRFIDMVRLCDFYRIPLAHVADVLGLKYTLGAEPRAVDSLLVGLSDAQVHAALRILAVVVKGLR